MNRRIFAIIFSLLFLISTTVNALSLKTNNHNLDDVSKDFSSSDSSKVILAQNQSTVSESLSNSTYGFTGPSKINSTGKGLILIVPLQLAKFDIPVPNIQYNFFPIRVNLFLIYCVYNDSNASTKITKMNGEVKWINGSHSLLLGMFSLPTINFLRFLLIDGLIDGARPLQIRFANLIGLPPIALLLTKLRDMFLVEPLMNISDSLFNFLREMKGIPPNYKPINPVFDLPWINNIWQIRVNIYIYWQLFLNLVGIPVKPTLIGVIMPINQIGYTPFVIWNKDPMFGDGVSKIQDTALMFLSKLGLEPHPDYK
jgi:hypothetical protein